MADNMIEGTVERDGPSPEMVGLVAEYFRPAYMPRAAAYLARNLIRRLTDDLLRNELDRREKARRLPATQIRERSHDGAD